MLKRMPEYDYSMPGPTDRVWMLARNPYSRVLSLYLHKVAGLCKFGSLGCQDIGEQMKFAGILGYNASAPPSFAAWVDLLATVMVRLQVWARSTNVSSKSILPVLGSMVLLFEFFRF